METKEETDDFQCKFNETFAIREIKYDKPNIQQPKAAEIGVIPTVPFRMYACGASGSGKTNLILNLLTRPEMYGGYFGDNIIVISPTARSLDPSYQVLEIPEHNFFPCSEEVLDRVFEVAKEAKKTKKMKPCLIILDDIISYKKFTNSKALLKLLVMGRHYNLSCMVLSQAYHRIPKSVRLNFSCIMFFKGAMKEVETISEEYCPAGYTKRQFMRLINDITKEKYSFLFVDLNRSIEDGRYRAGLTRKIV